MTRRVILTALLSVIGIGLIAFLLTLGNNISAPIPVSPLTNLSSPSLALPQGASDPNYTILCVKNGDGKIKFTKTGPYVTCPPDYRTLPLKLNPKLVKKDK